MNPEGVNRARSTIQALRPTAEEIAPRTVAALDAQGRMMLAAIDGVEALGLGLTLTELAEVGGSSSARQRGAHIRWDSPTNTRTHIMHTDAPCSRVNHGRIRTQGGHSLPRPPLR